MSGLRIPQIGSFFCPLGGEAGDPREIGPAVGSHCLATTKGRFRGFFGNSEIASPQISNPRVGGSSPPGRIAAIGGHDARPIPGTGGCPSEVSPEGEASRVLSPVVRVHPGVLPRSAGTMPAPYQAPKGAQAK